MKSITVAIKKTDNVQQIVYGEVYLPMVPDSDGEFMTAETIQIAAYTFMKNLRGRQIDVQHDNSVIAAAVVESFIARAGDPTFVEDAWVVGVYIMDDAIWLQIEKGELNGFSMQGMGKHTETLIEMEIPEFVEGMTEETNDHTHGFIVKFDEDGGFLGGWTDEVDGHRHSIIRGTATELVNDHNHRFAFVGVQHNAGT